MADSRSDGALASRDRDPVVAVILDRLGPSVDSRGVADLQTRQ